MIVPSFYTARCMTLIEKWLLPGEVVRLKPLNKGIWEQFYLQ